MKDYNPESCSLKMAEQIKELAVDLMQCGAPVQSLKPEHPEHVRDLTHPFDYGTGRKLRSDTQGKVASTGLRPPPVPKRISTLKKRQKKSTWRRHQSKAHTIYGKCAWRGCPGKKCSKAKRPRRYDTFMRCEECSAIAKKDVFLCNDHKKGTAVHCHEAFHTKYHNKKYKY